jgi:hypothetical protein
MPVIPLSAASSSVSWPEVVGQRADQTLNSLIAGSDLSGGTKTVHQMVRSPSPERVDIQNVFHVEVKSQTQGEDGTVVDLAEKLAIILHEQALQHGIDVT